MSAPQNLAAKHGTGQSTVVWASPPSFLYHNKLISYLKTFLSVLTEINKKNLKFADPIALKFKLTHLKKNTDFEIEVDKNTM